MTENESSQDPKPGQIPEIKTGLKENLHQFILLVIINGFVGGMVGMERSILPNIADIEFHIAAKTAIVSFIIVFGIVKAVTNYLTGIWANKFGRKNLLVAGWLFAIPVPFILMYANNWNWIIFANVLLGINQGLAWSSTVVMKIDLVGEKQRGLAMGLNEFAGYLAVAIVAFFTSWVAAEYGLRPFPFYIGIALSIAGFFMSWLFVKDTRRHMVVEAVTNASARLKNIFWDTTFRNKNLSTVTQAGLINNLNDAVVWGMFPMLLTSKGFDLQQTGIITAIYPAVWGITQLFTGKMADLFNKKYLLFFGMLLQGLALFAFLFAVTMLHFIFLSFLLGIGTAMVYPTFLATVAENTHPSDRANSIGTFRFWRDSGYAIGAVFSGLIADEINISTSILFTALITILSAFVIYFRMKTELYIYTK